MIRFVKCRSSSSDYPLHAHTLRQGSRVGEAAATTAAFVPLVIRCASNPHFLARVASARALAALVPPTEVPDVISELLGRLPKSEADAVIAMSAGAGYHNHVHGEKLAKFHATLPCLLVIFNTCAHSDCFVPMIPSRVSFCAFSVRHRRNAAPGVGATSGAPGDKWRRRPTVRSNQQRNPI